MGRSESNISIFKKYFPYLFEKQNLSISDSLSKFLQQGQTIPKLKARMSVQASHMSDRNLIPWYVIFCLLSALARNCVRGRGESGSQALNTG